MGFLGIGFKKQSAEEKYEAFTDKGKWKIAFGLIAQTLLRSGPIRFKIFFSALYLILYAVSIVFFRKSPAELKKIKERLKKEEIDEIKKEEDKLKVEEEKEERLRNAETPDYNKTRFGGMYPF